MGSFAAANFTIFGIFPSFIVKNGQKEMLQIYPISPTTFLTKIAPKRPEIAVPSISLKKETLGLQSQAFFLVPFGFKLIFFAYLAKKKVLNRRNVKHIKLVLSKKTLKFAAANEPTGYIRDLSTERDCPVKWSLATPSALESQSRANEGSVVANPICKCRCHKAGHLHVRVEVGR